MFSVYGRRMPITWTISEADRLVSARAHGTVTLQDIEALLGRRRGQLRCTFGYRKLFDGRESVGKYDDKDVLLLGARIQAYTTLNLTGAAAIVVSSKEQFDVALRFANIAKAKRPIRVFYSTEEARAWLDTAIPSSTRRPRRVHASPKQRARRTYMKVGFIGLGLMGSGISANLQKAGHAMVVHDARRAAADKLVAAGAEWAASPKAVAEPRRSSSPRCPDHPSSRRSRPARTACALCVQRRTAGLRLLDQFAHAHSAPSRAAVRRTRRAPVRQSGERRPTAGAASGKMAIWVGGDEAVFQRYRPVLDAAGDQILHIGPIGSASVAKLVHNLAGYVINTALAEAFTMGVKAGVEPLTLWKAIRQGANGRRRTFDTLGEHFLPGHYDPARFALKLAHKDVSLATQVGKEVGVPMRLSNLTLEEMTEALARGWEKRDSRSSMILQQERAGLAFSIDREEIAAILRDNANR